MSTATPSAPSSFCKNLLTSAQSNGLGPLSAVINPCVNRVTWDDGVVFCDSYPCLTLRSSSTHASRLNLDHQQQGNHLLSMIVHIFCPQITDALVILCRVRFTPRSAQIVCVLIRHSISRLKFHDLLPLLLLLCSGSDMIEPMWSDQRAFDT
ncbi:uncharacterized protein F5891DRAFT_993243 [Suillus fuscotomentosus]|uniref:Uncharacterized protein n=1 Tax=Suillus fuscotomentosus TaxID=1912939 RepID=A0AAD4HSH8_9AGAM|nr:uncharacterized protein F5891DRAFT_993243 [Suillus fuscotomentosus]KAG1908475.1 hypothetical protein F5891DRAFT_993243 [Suillus fuscotomentosus]